jgi:hypothetical protein
MLWLMLSAALAAPRPGAVAQVAAPSRDPARARLVFVGDSGQAPTGRGCSYRSDGSAAADCAITAPERDRLRASIAAVRPDAIYALGDLVYPMAPRCRRPAGAAARTLDRAIGDLYGDLGAPVWLVLGNHDLGHTRVSPARLRCLERYAEARAHVRLPAAQARVDHGLASVVVLNSNLRRQERLPARAVRDAAADGDWVLIAAHHELRAAFEKLREGPWEPPPPGRWLVDEDLHPHLWANGHAHTLQVGAYDARTADGGPALGGPERPVLALTSGAGSKLRAHPSCGPGAPASDQAACQAPHPRGMPAFSLSRFGFAVVDVQPETMTVWVLDLDGQPRHAWTRSREAVGGPIALSAPPWDATASPERPEPP